MLAKRLRKSFFWALTVPCALASSAAHAQTPPPRPAPVDAPARGFVTRTAVGVGLAHLTSGDLRFDHAARFNADVDVADFGRGRLNLAGDYEAMFGRERRAFDLNHENYSVALSMSYRAPGVELFAVVHHVSRHLADRENDRAVAWNSVGVAAERIVTRGASTFNGRLDVAKVFQHTFNDYAWSSWLSLDARRRQSARVEWYGRGQGGFFGIDDRSPTPRDRQCGARLESGLRLLGTKGGADVYVAYERRIDGYPLARTRSRWIELGFRLGN